MIELGKNVLEHGEGGRVEVILTKNKITVMARIKVKVSKTQLQLLKISKARVKEYC